MLGEDAVKNLLNEVLSLSKSDQTEAVFLGRQNNLTRYANSAIHQNVAEAETAIRVRAVVGRKVGVAVTNDVREDSLRQVVEKAVGLARLQADNPDFRSLPAPDPTGYVVMDSYVESTAASTPEERARTVGVVCRLAMDRGLSAAGAFSTGSQETAVANSLGVYGYHRATSAEIIALVMSDSGSGYADWCARDAGEIDAEAVATEAIEKALRSRNPVAVAPGDYEVVLQEYAVEDLVASVSQLGFSAQALQEGRSFMRLGQKVAGDNISIWDDALSPSGFPMPFDCEGVPKRRLNLIENGVAKAVAYDTYTAGREGRASTGHALPAPSAMGPLPVHLFLGTGESSLEEMVRGVKRGLWVTRFHYTRPVHPLRVIITGMTRDGTFLIENGEISRPVKNLRYTQSYLDALSNVTAIGRTAKLQSGFFGAVSVPALRVGRFAFTGATEF